MEKDTDCFDYVLIIKVFFLVIFAVAKIIFYFVNKNLDHINKTLDHINKMLDILIAVKTGDISTLSSCYIYTQDINGKSYDDSGDLVIINDDYSETTCSQIIYDELTKEESNAIFVTNYERRHNF